MPNTFNHGRKTVVYVDGWDVTTYLNEASPSNSRGEFDTTTFNGTGPGEKGFQPDSWEGTITLAGFWYNDKITVPNVPIQDVLDAAAVISLGKDGAAVGAVALLASVFETKGETPSSASDLISSSQDYRTAGIGRGKWLKAPGVVSASGNGISIDNGVLSAGAWQATLHLLSIDAGTLTPTFQHSADGTTWVNLQVGAALSAKGALYYSGGGTVQRYRRVIWALAGGATAANFVAAFSSRLA